MDKETTIIMLKDVIIDITDYMEELQPTMKENEHDWFQMLGLVKSLEAIQETFTSYKEELGLDYDIEKKYLL